MTLQRGRQVTHLIVGLDAGGAEHALLRLAEAQIAQGWNVNIIYLKASAYGLKDAFESLNISVFHISTLPKIADKPRALHENRGQHVIHSHLFYADSLGWMLKGLLNLPWVTTLHSTFDFHTRNSSRRAISKKLYPHADAVFAVSHEVSLSFEAECPRMNLHVIPNPVSKRFFKAPIEHTAQTGIKKLLLIGRLAPENVALRIQPQLSSRQLSSTIAGEGPLAYLLREGGHR